MTKYHLIYLKDGYGVVDTPVLTEWKAQNTWRFLDYIDIDAIDNQNHCIKEAKHLPVTKAPSRASRAVKTEVFYSRW